MHKMTQFASIPDSAIATVKGLAGLSVMVTLVMVSSPAQANDYERCTQELSKRQLSTEDIASACARALVPRDLGNCVQRIVERTSVAAPEALTACRQVRRPLDLAACTVDIRNRLGDSNMGQVLESCRRSLLPTRYADCVVGLAKSAKASTPQALETCIDAYYFPREVDPTFIPYPITSAPATLDTPTLTPMPELVMPSPQPVTPTPTPAPRVPALW